MGYDSYTFVIKAEWLLLIIFICFFLSLFLFKAFSNYSRRSKIKKKFSRGKEGEKEAHLFLEKHGYTILAEQVEEEGVVKIDGIEHAVQLRADFLVEKKGKISVVEVKTGDKATSALYSATRRQLLEYAINYPCDEILLYDADEKTLQKIEFKVKSHVRNKMSLVAHFIYVVVILSILAYFFKDEINLTSLLQNF